MPYWRTHRPAWLQPRSFCYTRLPKSRSASRSLWKAVSGSAFTPSPGYAPPSGRRRQCGSLEPLRPRAPWRSGTNQCLDPC